MISNGAAVAIAVVSAAVAAAAAWRAAAWRESSSRREAAQLKRRLLCEQSRFRALGQKLTDGVIIANLRGEVIALNAVALELLGAAASDVVSGGGGLAVPSDPDRWRMQIQNYLKGHATGVIIDRRSADAPARHYRTHVEIFSDGCEEDVGVLILLKDVTAEFTLEKMAQKKQEAV